MVALHLNKLAGQVNEMGRTMAERQVRLGKLTQQARLVLTEHGLVTEELLDKIARAHSSDQSWRGAEPQGNRLDDYAYPTAAAQPATLIAVDGSQIYPDRHGMATYYLLNTGSVVLRQGSGQAPAVEAQPVLFYQDGELYDDAGRLRDADFINRQRSHYELEKLAQLAEAERASLGGDISRPILALTDGPLLPWLPQRATDRDLAAEVGYLTKQLDRLRSARVIPVGYVDRPHSAYVLRTLELTQLRSEEINRDRVRKGPFRELADRLLFGNLGPNMRTALFASTSEINTHFSEQGHRVAFFYANMSRRPGAQHAIMARIEVPAWAAADPATLDLVQQVLYEDCVLTSYPYVLTRAHEVAVVTTAERCDLDAMLQRSMLRCGLQPVPSEKARNKQLLGSSMRRR